MSNLIKAEFFRIKHSGGQLKSFILVLLFGVFFSFMNDTMCIDHVSLSSSAFMGIMIIIAAIGISIGKHFNSRTAYYEIMDGQSPHTIILSRIILYSLITIAFYFVPVSLILMIFDCSTESVKFLFMLLLIMLRLLVFAVCISLVSKSAEGAALILPRILIELMPVMTSNNNHINMKSSFTPLLEWMPICQCTLLAHGFYKTLVIKIIAGFIIESLIIYLLAYRSYKKKWLIKTTLT